VVHNNGKRRAQERAAADACLYCGKPPDVEYGDIWVWMCPECDDIRMWLLEKYPTMNRGLLKRRMRDEIRIRNTIEDLWWMVEAGERNIAALLPRLPVRYEPAALERMLERRNPSLVRRIAWTQKGEAVRV
jgi:hypothetical protein